MSRSLDDFLGEEFPFHLPGDISVTGDSRFVVLSKGGSRPFVATRRACISGLISANARTSRLPGQTIPIGDLYYWMGWHETPFSDLAIKTLMYWGRPLGLISPAAEDGAVALPLASLISDLVANRPHPEILRQDLLAAYRKSLDVVESNVPAFTFDLCDFLQNGIVASDQKVLQIIYWRTGFRCSPMTLDQVGRRLNISRERVRQLEARILKICNQNRLLSLRGLALDFISSKGSRLLIHAGSRKDGWTLLSRLLEIEISESGKAPVRLLGIPADHLRKLNFQKWSHPELFGGAALRAITAWKPGLCWEDVITLRDHFRSCRRESMNIAERVYVALEHLGRPAHYSEISATYRQLFGDSKISDRNIHATLGRIKNVVYVGRKGTYGLVSDGAVRPSEDLHALVPEVLARRFGLMGVALPFEVVLGEVRKERPGADENSVKLILNMRAIRDENGRWLPRGASAKPAPAPVPMSSKFSRRITR